MDEESLILLKLKYDGLVLDLDNIKELIQDLHNNNLIIWTGVTNCGLISICSEFLPESFYLLESRKLEEKSTFVVLQESIQEEKEILDIVRSIGLEYSCFYKSNLNEYFLNIVVI